MARYKINVYRAGWLAYDWTVHNAGATSAVPTAWGRAYTKTGARRAAEKWAFSRTPVLTKEVEY